jgi:hypothetical protein
MTFDASPEAVFSASAGAAATSSGAGISSAAGAWPVEMFIAPKATIPTRPVTSIFLNVVFFTMEEALALLVSCQAANRGIVNLQGFSYILYPFHAYLITVIKK